MRKIIFLLIFSLSCAESKQSDSLLESISPQGGHFVEAVVEYSGPDARWAGPQNFVLRVQVSQDHQTKVSWIVPEFKDKAMFAGRQLASVPKDENQAGAIQDQMRALAFEIQKETGAYTGCLWPVRVRMVRNDGVVIERRGCRGQNRWTERAGRFFDQMLSASIYQTHVKNGG